MSAGYYPYYLLYIPLHAFLHHFSSTLRSVEETTIPPLGVSTRKLHSKNPLQNCAFHSEASAGCYPYYLLYTLHYITFRAPFVP